MRHTTMETDEPPAITVKYDNMSLPSPLPSDQIVDQIPDWVHNIIIGDWVIVHGMTVLGTQVKLLILKEKIFK